MCCQEFPQYLGKLNCNFLFSIASCICVIMLHCDYVDVLVCRQIVIDVGDIPQCCIPDITGLEFLHHILDKGRYTKGTRCLCMSIVDFSVAGINIILTCLKAVDIYPVVRQALICIYF